MSAHPRPVRRTGANLLLAVDGGFPELSLELRLLTREAAQKSPCCCCEPARALLLSRSPQ
jgi:hypothetical protein